MQWLFQHIKGDRYIWFIVLGLSLFSMLAVYSSTGTIAYKYHGGNTEYYLLKHGVLMLFGFLMMFAAHKINYFYYSRFAQVLMYLSIPLLIFTLAFGTEINYAKRWITIPIIDMSFQTSDLAKIALIMYLARTISKHQGSIKDFVKGFLPLAVPVVLVCAFIAPEDLSTAALLFATSLLLMFIGRVRWKHISLLVLVASFGMMMYISYMIVTDSEGRVDTWIARIERFWSGEGDNFQVVQAKIAIANGGMIGVGPGQSIQRNFLPYPYSDYIFAIIVEEYGLFGGALVVFLYMAFLYRAMLVFRKSPGAFGAMLAVGLSISLVSQALLNIAVTVNLLPVTGVTLPLVSMGGTSIVFTSIAVGIVLSVSRYIELQKDKDKYALA